MLTIDEVEVLAHYEPPRPARRPPRRVTVYKTGTDGDPAYIEDWGLEPHTPIRFVSSETQGFLTPDQVADLEALYAEGGEFEVVTDLLQPLTEEEPRTYAAVFDPESVPLFPPATPGGTLHYMDIALLLTEVEGS